MTLDDATLVFDKLNLDIFHTGTNYYFDNQDHKANLALEGHQRRVKHKLVDFFSD